MSEKILIKHQVLSADKYCRTVTQQVKKKANEYYQQAKQEQEAIYQTAYQQGYNEGVKQLLTDFIHTLETSEIQYQENVSQSKKQLVQILNDFFGDNHIQEIVALYFEKQHQKVADITLHLPTKMQSRFVGNNSDMKLATSINNTIALEVNNKITYFSPVVASKNILPHIFSVPTQCQILQEHKNAHQNLIAIINSIQGESKDADKSTN